MLTISSKSKYGILATLSLAKHSGQGLMQIKDISSQNNIPLQYLAQIFSLLVKADIIKSVRGKNGGYKLSRSPSLITVLEILEVLEGGIELVENENVSDDVIHELFYLAESKLREVFNVSLADLLSRQLEKKHILQFDI
jgi:Rrf2 family protein